MRKKIENLTKKKQLAFTLLLCERMVPALAKFSKETGFNYSFYRFGLDSAWNSLIGDAIPPNCEIANQYVDLAPDTEEFDHPLTSAALNAALSIAAAISLLADGNVNHVVEAASLARDTAALHAQAVGTISPKSFNFDEIIKHPLVQREIRQQAEDLEFLESLPNEAAEQETSLIKKRAAETPMLIMLGGT